LSSPTETTSIANPFTQTWIQALTLAADNPLARTIKTKLEWIDRLSMSRQDADRLEAAKGLWEFSQSEGLQDLIWHLPVNAPTWVFDHDDVFTYSRNTADNAGDARNFERWLQVLGLAPGSFQLMAEVAGSDWTGLVRKEAVRLQHALDTTAVPQGANLNLPCTANWDSKAWTVRFDQVNWIAVTYDDPPMVPRPTYAETEERLIWSIATANDLLVSPKAVQCPLTSSQQPWHAAVAKLSELHAEFCGQARSFSPWMSRVWNCVWPVVYREQNLLNGLADITFIRTEIKACLTAQPRLTMWMFVYARLVCQLRLGRGLGLLADFHG
jgi:hypothetical protein